METHIYVKIPQTKLVLNKSLLRKEWTELNRIHPEHTKKKKEKKKEEKEED